MSEPSDSNNHATALHTVNNEIEKTKEVIKDLAVKFKIQYDKLIRENNIESALQILEFNSPYLLAFVFDESDIAKINDINLKERTDKIINGIKESKQEFSIQKITEQEFSGIAARSMSVDVGCAGPACTVMGGKKSRKTKNKKRTYKKR